MTKDSATLKNACLFLFKNYNTGIKYFCMILIQNCLCGTQGSWKAKNARTIICSLGKSTLNLRSGIAHKEGGKGRNIS